MSLISFHLTGQQVRDRTKDITRRLGWVKLQPGERLLGVEKSRGVRVEDRVILAEIRVKTMRREPLNALLNPLLYSPSEAREEVNREGFPHLTPQEFVGMFCKEMDCKPSDQVTRIEFEYL